MAMFGSQTLPSLTRSRGSTPRRVRCRTTRFRISVPLRFIPRYRLRMARFGWQGSDKLGRWDPNTQKITEFQDQYMPGKEGIAEGGEKHTVRLDPSGNVWASGVPLTKFDPETRKFTRFEEVTHAYDVKPDKNGDVWFTNPRANKIGKVDGKTMKVTMWTVPSADAYPRRMEIASDGTIWFGE